MFVVVIFFFFKQKTAYEMRISDWSSDVCSSDLHQGEVGQDRRRGHRSWPLRHVPDGRSCRTPRSVPGHPAADRSTATTYPYNGLNGRKKRGGSEEGCVRMRRSRPGIRSEEHTSELQSLMRISYAVFCLKQKNNHHIK